MSAPTALKDATGDIPMNQQTALTSVVTASVLEEFKLLKFSFELFHGGEYQWFVRCDQASTQTLSSYPNIACQSFTDVISKRPDIESKDYRNIVGEKMKAMETAWESDDWKRVLYFDADIIITAPVIGAISTVGGDVVLTPNYYPDKTKHFASQHGIYNGGFICTRNRRFHRWWQDAFISQPHRWTDQACLNDAHQQFSIGTLSERANIGFWRSANIPHYEPIPANCEFLHAHTLQPLVTTRDWIDKTFSLHCLKFLRGSLIPEHRRLLKEILVHDESGWYEASLRLC